MIGYLKGKILQTYKDSVILDVNGVGYLISVTKSVSVGDTKEYFVHTHVREDTFSLFGFSSQQEIELFKMLLMVSGVGPKAAISIMTASDVNRIYSAVSKADVGFFTAVPGIGKKGAQKIIIELKGKIGSVQDIDLGDEGDDIVDALMSMGFDRNQIKKVMVKLDPNLSDEDKIREAIRLLGRKHTGTAGK